MPIKPANPVLNRGDPLANGLMAAWLFNEGTGVNPYDICLNHIYLVISGTMGWLFGLHGRVLVSSGGGGYTYTGVTNFGVGGLLNFTWSWWIDTDPAYNTDTTRGIIGQGNGATTSDSYVGQASILVRGTLGLLQYVPGSSFTLAGLHHYALTRTPTSITLYRDGMVLATVTGSDCGPVITPSALSFTIGAVANLAGWYRGGLDTVLVHNRALSPAEINLLYLDSWRMFRPVPLLDRPSVRGIYIPPPVATGADAMYYYQEHVMRGGL